MHQKIFRLLIKIPSEEQKGQPAGSKPEPAGRYQHLMNRMKLLIA